jgi:hypothetical protein
VDNIEFLRSILDERERLPAVRTIKRGKKTTTLRGASKDDLDALELRIRGIAVNSRRQHGDHR